MKSKYDFHYDWIDAILMAVGFIAGVGIALASRSLGFRIGSTGMSIEVELLVLGLPLLRRSIFGMPELPPPRTGALWSLLSICGLLAVILGMGGMAISAVVLSENFAPEPDFAAQVRADYERFKELQREDADTNPHSLLRDLHALAQANETPEQRRARAVQERQEAADKDALFRLERRAQLRTAWTEHRQSSLYTGLSIAMVALIIVGIGSLALRFRYTSK